MKILGIIPARGGSKRLPRKNMKRINNQTLLEITIKQGMKVFPVVVSSEDDEILTEASRCGASVIVRPFNLAADRSTSAEVIDHVLQTYDYFDWFCLLQVTSPLRTVEDIETCMEIAERTDKPVVSTFKGEPNGAVYIGKTSSLAGDFFKEALHYEMPEERSLDINTLGDFLKAAEYLNCQKIDS